MANCGLDIEIKETDGSGSWVEPSDYQIGVAWSAYGNPSPFTGAEVHDNVGSLAFDSGHVNGEDIPDPPPPGHFNTFYRSIVRVMVQHASRDPISVAGSSLVCDNPMFAQQAGQSGSYSNSVPGGVGAGHPIPGDLLRIFVVKIVLKVEWESGANVLKERFVLGGGMEWNAAFNNNNLGNSVASSSPVDCPLTNPYGSNSFPASSDTRFMGWYTPGGASSENDFGTYFPSYPGGEYLTFSHTDAGGEITYRAVVGYAWRIAGVWAWFPAHEGTDPADAGASKQNLALYVDRQGEHTSPANPHAGYSYAQWVTDPATDAGQGWSVDYSSWDGAGNLTAPTFGLVTHAYQQGVTFTVKEPPGVVVPGATVTMGPYSGVTDGSGHVTLMGVPNGSTLANPSLWVTNSSATFTAMPVQDTAPFSGKGEAWIARPSGPAMFDRIIRDLALTPFAFSGGGIDPIYAGAYHYNNYDGGEAVVVPYALSVSKAGYTTNTGTILVYEDQLTARTLHIDPDGSGPGDTRQDGDLDLIRASDGEPHLAAADGDGLTDYPSTDLEATFDPLLVLSDADRIGSPSRVVPADHAHGVAFIQGGDVKWRVSEDTEAYPGSAATVSLGGYSAVKALLDPDGSTLHLWPVSDAGDLYHFTSGNGGALWDVAPVSGLPVLQPLKPDVLHDGERFYLGAGLATGEAKLYSSRDGEAWTLESQIAASGEYVALTPIDGGLLAAVETGGTILVYRGTADAAGAWTWEAGVTAATGTLGVGHGVYGNTQKHWLAYFDGAGALAHQVSMDEGETFASGAAG